MAAYVANRQFGRPDSPVRGCSFPPLVSIPSTSNYPSRAEKTEEEEEEEEDEERIVDWLKTSISLEVEPSIHDPRDQGTADAWIERNPSLLRLTGKHPFNSEAPLSLLMQHGFLTPSPLHYVRNHGPVPRAHWSHWSLQVSGLVSRPRNISMDDLLAEFPPVEIPVTLVCAGNRRKEQNMVRKTSGFNWGPGAVSTSVWRGARLRDVLLACGVASASRGALNVCFEGAEDLPGGGGSKYGTSLPRAVAMDPTRDIMLAYMQNGEPLAPDHGFPVRVIIPGFIGGRMVKWLRRIIVTPTESDNHYHFKDNRVLPGHVDAELADAEAWWYKPEHIINELNVNSVITTPGHDEMLPINSVTTQRSYTMKGYAYSGGGRKVTRVEITVDGGETWRVCSLDHPERPNKYGKYWCWCFWSLEVEVLDLLGTKEIAVRAWDESHNTQPEKLNWNVMGMMNNCWFRVKINMCRPHKGEIGLLFEHPTQPGNQSGGWMARQKHRETSDDKPQLKKSLSTPFMNTSTQHFTISDVRKHSSRDSPWIIVHGNVYDCTAFLKDHPGGADSILINAGTDATEEFDAIHSEKAKSMLETYRIGELITTGYTSDASVHGAANLTSLTSISEATVQAPPPALANPREKIHCKLVSKTTVSGDVRLFRFALPSADQVLGLPVGKHVFLRATIGNKLCMRAYTPTSMADTVGHLELLVKIYFKDENPKFPEGGLMSQHLESLPIGSSVDVKGPLGHIEYTGRGNFLVDGKPRFARRLAMMAGGTGITPLYQVIQAVLRDRKEDRTEMHLVYANRTEDDILLREELDRWAEERPEQFKVWYVLSNAKRKEEWKYSEGYVTESILREHIPMGGTDDTLALVCGPPPMIKSAVVPNLEKMGYDVTNSCLVF